MIFDTFDNEFLMLCGLCRYIPSGLQKVYDAPFLKRSIINNLQVHGMIKMMSDGRSYHLTRTGKDILADMGYEFPDDLRTDINKTAYKRKLKNAEINIMMYLAGINVFYKFPYELSDKNGYASSLMMRADKNMKVLSSSQFLGIMTIGDTAYITYFVDSEDMDIIPSFEKEIISAQIHSIKNVRQIKLLIFGNTLDSLCEYLFIKPDKPPIGRGRKRFGEALEVMGMEYILVPCSNGGVTQLTVLNNFRYRSVIAEALDCEKVEIPQFNECDGLIKGKPCIIGVDMNIERIIRALKQSEHYEKNKMSTICCLSFQRNVLERILKEKNAPNHKIAVIERNGLKQVFPGRITERAGYITEGGEYIEAPAKAIRKNK